jgi:hypothetical protein
MSWQSDKAWSDKFIPMICKIVGPHLLVPAPFQRDANEASDLIVLIARDLTLACRVRRHGFSRYFNQFTIRSGRASGTKTEFDKIAEGWGDWMFYGHANEVENGFDCWNLLDLRAWRCHLIRKATRKTVSNYCGETSNGDGTSFMWFDINGFIGEPNLVISNNELEAF